MTASKYIMTTTITNEQDKNTFSILGYVMIVPTSIYYAGVQTALNNKDLSFDLKDGELYWRGVLCQVNQSFAE